MATFTPSDWNDIYTAGAVWATIHGASTGTLRNAPTASYTGAYFDGGAYYIDRIFFVFNTATIPDDAIISSATFSLDGTSTKVTNGVRHYALYDTTCGDTVVADDFNNQGSTIQSDQIAQADLPADTSTATWTLNAAGLTSINVSGLTKFCLLEVDKDVANVAPTEITYWRFSTPVLTVNYTTPAGGSFILSLLD
jgi:hypothetical protein